jgi:hypothetical protein
MHKNNPGLEEKCQFLAIIGRNRSKLPIILLLKIASFWRKLVEIDLNCQLFFWRKLVEIDEIGIRTIDPRNGDNFITLMTQVQFSGVLEQNLFFFSN